LVTVINGMEWLTILSQPIVQVGGILGVMYSLDKAGFNVKGAVKSFIGINSGVTEVNADTRNALQPLLSEMEKLSLHFNHETTDNQNRIAASIEHMHDKQDAAVQLLREIKEYGIKCRH
jgi:UDP-3-O-acyl-N-acetylglucosamine deacetylase